MGATYEFWLEDDSGARITILDKFFSVSYSRNVAGLGTFQMYILYDEIKKKINPIFKPDWRVSCWRSPADGIPLRRERTYMLRLPRIYLRESDSVLVVEYMGRDGVDLLARRVIPQAVDSSYASKTMEIDDMMKEIVSEAALYGTCVDENGNADNARAFPSGEFFVQANSSLGPITSKTFQDRLLLDVLKDLRDESFSLNSINGSEKIYFDVVEKQIPGTSRFGWEFQTFAGIRGADRTSNKVFSYENENMRAPLYLKNYMDEVNAVYVKNKTTTLLVTDDTRIASSRWNRMEAVRFGYFDESGEGLESVGNEELGKNVPIEQLDAVFLNVPGTKDSPRSLYGVDWDFGDLLKVNFAGMQFNVDVKIVYVSINELGVENITGRNRVN